MDNIPVLKPIPATGLKESIATCQRISSVVYATSPPAIPHLPETDADRLAYLDSQRAYIEMGPIGKGGYITFEDGCWRVCKWNGAIFNLRAECPTLREAIDCYADEYCEMPHAYRSRPCDEPREYDEGDR